MKLLLSAVSLLAMGFMAQSALANDEFIASCEAYNEANDADVDCTCLDEAASDDPSLYEEYAKVSKPEDAENMSEAAKEVVAMCASE